MSYLSRLRAILIQDGTDLDVTENTVLDGARGQTISMRCALAEHTHWWAKAACWGLNAVQWRHCACQRAGLPMTGWNYLRAVLALICIPAALVWGAVELLRLF